jgi:hypothetical protein
MERKNLSLQERCEGKSLYYNVGNRVSGMAMYSFGMIAISTANPIALVIGLPLAIEGVGDALTGHHHYCGRRVYEFFNGRWWFG